MKIVISLSEACKRALDWEVFCDDLGLDYYCLQYSDGEHEITLSEEQAKKSGLIKE